MNGIQWKAEQVPASHLEYFATGFTSTAAMRRLLQVRRGRCRAFCACCATVPSTVKAAHPGQATTTKVLQVLQDSIVLVPNNLKCMRRL